MMRKKYLNAVKYGNPELIYMMTRSLTYSSDETSITVNRNRYIDELKLYKYYTNKGIGSILCSLIPLILANLDVKIAFREAAAFFGWIKKSLSVRERAGLHFLSIYLHKGMIGKEDIYEYKLSSKNKLDLLENEKIKIEMIMNYDKLEQFLLQCIGEKDLSSAELILTRLFDEVERETEDRMVEYFEKFINGRVKPPSYRSDFSIEHILSLQEGQSSSSSLLGEARLLKRQGHELILQTKRGLLTLDDRHRSFLNQGSV